MKFKKYLFFVILIVLFLVVVVTFSAEAGFNFRDRDKVKKRIVFRPKILKTAPRIKRGTAPNKPLHHPEETLQLSLGGDSNGFFLNLRKNENLVTERGVIEWHFANGTIEKIPLKNVLETKQEKTDKKTSGDGANVDNVDCLFVGTVVGKKSSLAAVEICDGYHGYIQIGTDGYIIRPLVEAIYGSESLGQSFYKKNDSPHVLEFLGESLDNLNVRDDILASDKNVKKSFDEGDVDEKEFYDFLSTGRHRKNDVIDFEMTSEEEDKMFDDFLTTGKHATKKFDLSDASNENDVTLNDVTFNDVTFNDVTLNEDMSNDVTFNDVTSNDILEETSREQRFKRHVNDENDFLKVDDFFAQKDSLFGGSSWDGHYIGDIWSSGLGHSRPRYANRRNKLNDRPGSGAGHIICNGPFCEYYQVKKDEPKWLKLAVAVDADVIAFHGPQTVKRYVLTLLNIMSAIYGDPTLGANLKFVILRLIFYEGSDDVGSRNFDPIEEGNSKQSLENVNQWNDALWRSLAPDERHDAAIWLTRRNIGGPSGYAPVAGICDPARSCSLNRDEGLSSAFIIAHELGHILGMSHDGDLGAGNDCKEEASQGSVMAPMVGATFSYFHWSSCSAGEYHYKSSTWSCMHNYPHTVKNATFIGDVIEYTYSLDDQCRMEFGKGFKFCRSFQLNDPCTHLWCSHQQSPDICKTKKGPPMDGTECGKGLWCVSGYCESMEKRRTNKDGLKHNPRAGGWGPWTSWGDCSRTCGTGVQFRSRQCDNPRPAYGGTPCLGDNEEFRLCNIETCPVSVDFRAMQCKHLFEVVSMDILARDLELGGLVDGSSIGKNYQTWFPYEHEEASFKCKLTCFSRDTGEYYQTGENVIDGTPCSYDNPSNICVQGKCIQLGCDKIIGSPVEEDECGVCGGDGSKCRQKSRSFVDKVTSKVGGTKILMIPAGARNIRIAFRSKEKVTVTLKERDTNLLLVNGTELLRRNRTSFVSEGAKFNFSKIKIAGSDLGPNEEEFISARGPILGPIVVLAASEIVNASFNAVVNFTVSRVNEPMSTVQQYEWAIKGWSKCSKECGGGKQHLVMSCVDKFTGRNIRKKLCGRRPAPVGKNSRKCNTFGCDFSWVADRWEECSATCGLHGIRIRQTYCIPNNVIARSNLTDNREIGRNHDDYDDDAKDSDARPWMHMVNPKKCRGNRPPRVQECNRVPCPAQWTPVGWSSCSSTCGDGIERRIFECRPNDETEIFYDCGLEPVSERRCRTYDCPETCDGDESPICKEEVMKRYCVIPSYRQRCCESCSSNSNDDAEYNSFRNL